MSSITTEAPVSVAPAAASPDRRLTTDPRRWIQLGLAVVWVLDGLLQFQSFFFTKAFSTQILAPTAEGNPAWIAHSILWSAKLVEADPVVVNGLFATLQLAIGLAIASRRAVAPALAVSIVWSLVVWWFGEGLGGLLVPGASPLQGAPGAVLLYAVLAVLVWPAGDTSRGSYVAAKPLGTVTSKAVWIVLWGGLAALNLEPANLTRQSVHALVDGMGAGQPAWVDAVITGFTAASAGHGIALSVGGAVILGLIAVAILFPPRVVRGAVIAAVIAAAFIWLVGQALGGLVGGQSTDVNSGPLLGLIAIAYWPRLRSHSAGAVS